VTVMGIPFSGSVDSRGRLAIRILHNLGKGRATGRLSGDRGHGTWRGTLGTNDCAGTWAAQRR
jgi:hypothetical protein